MEEQIERLRRNYNEDVHKLKKQFEEECRLLDEHMEKEITMERNYMENCNEIEIGKLKEEMENKIETLNKNRYQSIEKNEADNSQEINAAMEKNREHIEKELARDRESFEIECRERRQRFEEQMKLLLVVTDQRRIEYLKVENVPFVKANGTIKITDESLLDSRYRLKFTRNAIRSAQSWAMYRGQYQDKPIICRVVVISKIPNEIRANMDHSTKCYRYLCEKQRQADHSYFVDLYEIFSTEQKIYIVTNEYSSKTMLDVIQPQRLRSRSMTTKITYNEDNLKRWLGQICDALNFMHTLAVAHLNLRLDNIIFDEHQNIRLVGLSHLFCYFNLDQEKFVKAPRVSPTNVYDHLPPECFDGDFDACRADVWSFGLLIYEAHTRSNPRKQLLTISREKGRSQTRSMKKVIDRQNVKFPPFDFDKIHNQSLRQVLELMLSNYNPFARPNFERIQSYEYFHHQSQQ